MPTLHFVSHTHWDREWYLTFQQFRLKFVHLLDNLLAILEADPDYKHFMLDGQTILLEDYLQLRPERAAAIRAQVQSGRLLIGPWHILPDEFLVSPEATVRNLLQGERTARQFGAKMMVGYTPDPFGHIGQLPQILRGFKIESAVLRRGLADEPCELWWEAPDGSRVFTAYLRDGYSNAAAAPTSDPQRFAAEVSQARDSLAPHAAAPHLLLMHGTDHMPPPPDTPAALASANGNLNGDQLIHSTLPAYLAAIQSAIGAQLADLPTVRGELRSPKRHHLLPGVLSTRMWIKQRNHACQTLLEQWAEPFSVWAGLLDESGTTGMNGTERLVGAAPIVRYAWRMLMECHPHDSICGCSVDQVHEEMRPRFDQVEQIGEEITRQSLDALAAAIDTSGAPPGGAAAIVVFNPAAGPRTDAVTVSLRPPAGAEDLQVVDEAGNVLPHEIAADAVRFVAADVPGYGYRTFWAAPAQRRPAAPAAVPPPAAIENEFFTVQASAQDGTLTLKDKCTGAVYRGLNRFVDGGDCGDEYNYCPPLDETLVYPEARAIRIERTETRQSIEAALTLRVPLALSENRRGRSAEKAPLAVTTRVTLTPGVPRADILTTVDNPASDHRLRVHFPAPFAAAAADYDGHFEVVRRPVGRPSFDDSWIEQPRPEAPQRAFTDVSDGKAGLMIANRGLPEVEVLTAPDGSAEIALTLLRCVGWLSRDDFPARTQPAGPLLAAPGAQMIGRHTFEYAIIPHRGGWQNAFREAYAFNAPLRAAAAAAHDGRLPGRAALVRVSPSAFVLSAVKAADDDDGLIVRGYNISADEIAVTLTLWKRFGRIARVSLAEEVMAELTPAADGSVTFASRGYEIVTIKFRE